MTTNYLGIFKEDLPVIDLINEIRNNNKDPKILIETNQITSYQKHILKRNNCYCWYINPHFRQSDDVDLQTKKLWDNFTNPKKMGPYFINRYAPNGTNHPKVWIIKFNKKIVQE